LVLFKLLKRGRINVTVLRPCQHTRASKRKKDIRTVDARSSSEDQEVYLLTLISLHHDALLRNFLLLHGDSEILVLQQSFVIAAALPTAR